MNIEKYSEISPQYYNYTPSPTLLKYLNKYNYSSLLDCGCGDGALLYALKHKNYLTDTNVYAIDLSLRRVDLVKKIDADFKVYIDNAEELKNIRDKSIDFFISTQVIEHISDRLFVNNLGRIIKEDGIIYITTVFKKWYGWYFYRNNKKWVLDPTHIREYKSDNELLDLFDKSSFVLLESNKNPICFPLISFFIKRLKIKNRYIYQNRILSFLSNIKIPIFGYYEWELVFKKL